MIPEEQILGDFARRLRTEEGFMAHLLQTYMRQEGMDEAQVAAQLGIAPRALVELAICLAPRAEPERFGQDVQSIADAVGADATELARIARRVQAVEALQQVRHSSPGTLTTPEGTHATSTQRWHGGLLAAARDRDPGQPDAESELNGTDGDPAQDPAQPPEGEEV